MVTYKTSQVVRDTNGDVVVTRKRVEPGPVPDEPPQTAYQKKKTIFRTYQIVWYILGFIETVLIFRFLLLMFGANPNSGFADLIYTLSHPFALPFLNLFTSTRGGGIVVEWSTLIAMAVYPLIATGIVKLFQLIKPTTPEEVERAVDVE